MEIMNGTRVFRIPETVPFEEKRNPNGQIPDSRFQIPSSADEKLVGMVLVPYYFGLTLLVRALSLDIWPPDLSLRMIPR